MKITFHLDSEDRYDNIREAKLILSYGAWKGVVEDMDHFLRGKIKYEDHAESVDETYRAVREELHSLLKGSGLELFTE